MACRLLSEGNVELSSRDINGGLSGTEASDGPSMIVHDADTSSKMVVHTILHDCKQSGTSSIIIRVD